MKLVIKEYLSLLKESKELDDLIPELLLSMNHKTISKAQVGTRQYGVDVTSIGKDADGIEKVFLFTIKEGNLSRADWDGGSNQAVRPSLDEILDVYIPTHLEKKYLSLPKKIVVATGGDLNQNVQQNWSGYTKRHSVDNEIEFAFWGGDELSILIEENLFNEHLIPKELRSKFRKTLALLNDIDYDLRDYYSYLNEIINNSKLEKQSEKKQLKTLRLIYLSLNIIYRWADSEDNLKHALLASERTLLNIWEFLSKNKLTENKKLTEIIGKIYYKNLEIISKYCEKLQPLIKIKNGMSFYGNDFIQESLILFEQLGILALLGNLFQFTAIINNNAEYVKYSASIALLIKEFIKNHKALLNPLYDEHIIDISLAIFLLHEWNEIKFVDEWISDLITHIDFAFNINGKYFPIDTDNFDDLVDINLRNSFDKNDYVKTSTLIPILAQWCVKLGLIENYKDIQQISEDIFKKATLQIWYPDERVEDFMFSTNAGFECGYAEAPIKIPKKIKDYSKLMEEVQKSENYIDIQSLLCVKHSMTPLILISCRHFRMPLFPQFWNIKAN
ncbi:hypothetical protein [Arcobacter aquimarinus]|uniref:Chemotaxis protein n=1 Tax=Arcobacter aquimarinus TaxID=1315211 RepID=A0AAE7E1N3_9BACT|nr:hypothetical protein [Arcobacter aquimarinus]QKE26077.1 hypothetical protein AAQM_1328 [Arcobacter aquimarinus]RXI33887.1 hypothetical protein CP986_09990 [Arcobacter aquimarinus]